MVKAAETILGDRFAEVYDTDEEIQPEKLHLSKFEALHVLIAAHDASGNDTNWKVQDAHTTFFRKYSYYCQKTSLNAHLSFGL